MRPKQSMQFTVKHLSLDEQREEIELKKGSPEYTQRNYKCKDCGLGFISEDVFEEHILKHSEVCQDITAHTTHFKQNNIVRNR